MKKLFYSVAFCSIISSPSFSMDDAIEQQNTRSTTASSAEQGPEEDKKLIAEDIASVLRAIEFDSPKEETLEIYNTFAAHLLSENRHFEAHAIFSKLARANEQDERYKHNYCLTTSLLAMQMIEGQVPGKNLVDAIKIFEDALMYDTESQQTVKHNLAQCYIKAASDINCQSEADHLKVIQWAQKAKQTEPGFEDTNTKASKIIAQAYMSIGNLYHTGKVPGKGEREAQEMMQLAFANFPGTTPELMLLVSGLL